MDMGQSGYPSSCSVVVWVSSESGVSRMTGIGVLQTQPADCSFVLVRTEVFINLGSTAQEAND